MHYKNLITNNKNINYLVSTHFLNVKNFISKYFSFNKFTNIIILNFFKIFIIVIEIKLSLKNKEEILSKKFYFFKNLTIFHIIKSLIF